jgi:hypothetical protein
MGSERLKSFVFVAPFLVKSAVAGASRTVQIDAARAIQTLSGAALSGLGPGVTSNRARNPAQMCPARLEFDFLYPQ